MIMEIVEGGEKRLAFPVGPSAASRTLARITTLRSSPGWIIKGEEARQWLFEGFLERDGVLYLYGPHSSCRSLSSVLEPGLAEALPSISLLIGSLLVLSRNGLGWFPLETDGVYFIEGGGVLFLPPEVLRELRGLRPFEANRDTFEVISHPDLKDEQLASFSISALLYRASTGRFPYGGSTAEEIHEEVRKREILPPDRIVPELSPDFSKSIMSCLSGQHSQIIRLDRWKELADSWIAKPPLRELSQEEKEQIAREAATQGRAANRRYRRRVFWQRNRMTVAIVAGICLIAGAVLGTILKGVLAPRPTHGFSPQKVVETFYNSMNTLDQTVISACVIGKAGRTETTEVTNLYVISRMNLGYTGKSSIISASDWDAKGRPKPAPGISVYGVTNLTVTWEQGPPNPVFLARYEKWRPATPPDDSNQPPQTPTPSFEGSSVTDRLSLKQDRGDWVIFDIERLKEEPIDTSRWK